jgi:hypothetical protein
MKVLVLNGSPRGERGATAGVLTPFVEGMRDAGADVEVSCMKWISRTVAVVSTAGGILLGSVPLMTT